MTHPRSSVYLRLVAKDLYLQRGLIVGATAVGAATLALSSRTRDLSLGGLNLGFLLYLTAIITFGILVPMLAILKERQEGTQLFVLSLPISPRRYRSAKVVAAAIAFLIPWTTLTLGVAIVAWWLPETRAGLPFFVALMGFLLGNFATLTAIVASTKSEIWAVVGILATNVSVTPFLVHLGRVTRLAEGAAHAASAAPLWNPEVRTLLIVESLWIAAAFAVAVGLPRTRGGNL